MQDKVTTLACDAGLRCRLTCDGGCWLVGDSNKTCEAEAFACWACKRMRFCGVGALKYVRCSGAQRRSLQCGAECTRKIDRLCTPEGRLQSNTDLAALSRTQFLSWQECRPSC